MFVPRLRPALCPKPKLLSPLSPITAVQRAILGGLGPMRHRPLLGPLKIGNAARNFQYPVVSANGRTLPAPANAWRRPVRKGCESGVCSDVRSSAPMSI
jgi:hypothetical protein